MIKPSRTTNEFSQFHLGFQEKAITLLQTDEFCCYLLHGCKMPTK